MEIVALLIVLIVVLIISEYRHVQDRTEYKELALNQQNHIKELLEIIRFRNGMSAIQNLPPVPNVPAIQKPTDTQVKQADSTNPSSKVTEKPLGYMARIKQQEKEIENANQSF